MRRNWISAVVAMAAALIVAESGSRLLAQTNVLVNGSLDLGVAPPGWTIDTFISDEPETSIPSVFEHNDGSNNPVVQGLGIVLHPQIGNQGAFVGQDRRVNFIMEQTYSNVMTLIQNRTFTFKADVALQQGYSGVVENLNELHPFGDYNDDFVVNAADYTVWRDNLGEMIALPNEGPTPGMVDGEDYTEWKNRYGQIGHDAIASPTVTKLEMEFLDAGDNQLGPTHVWDMRNNVALLNDYRTGIDMVSAQAPAGSTKVRVRVSALDMLDNPGSGGQDVLFDNFSLKDGSSASPPERLVNGNLNTAGEPLGWVIQEGPTVDQGMGPITADSASFIGFANRKIEDTSPPIDKAGVPSNPSGQGLWIKPFINETGFEPDIPTVFANATQTVSGATVGAEYTLSAWTAWEFGYAGGFDPSVETFLKIEFLDAAMSVIGGETLNLFDAGMRNDDTNDGLEWEDWQQFFVSSTAPAGTDKVRVSVGANEMYHSGINPQSVFFDEFELIETLPGGGGLAAPEPASAVLIGIALAWFGVRRRNR